MVTDRLGEAARLLRDAETEEPTAPAVARWMLDLARTHAAIAQAEATARLVDHLTYRRDKDWATQALLEPYEPEHVVHVGDVWGHSGRRYVVTHALDDGWVALDPKDGIGGRTWLRVDDLTRERSRWRLLERDGKPWPTAQERQAIDEARVAQAERERDEAVARAEKAERERDEAVARADELKGIRWRADAATRKAQERAEAAEAEVARMRPVVEAAVAEVARMRPVVEAAVDWDMAMVDLDDLAVAVTEYRAARKEAGGKSWLPAQEDQS